MSNNSTISYIQQQVSSTRTVWDILWSSLFVIFTCTWTVQHLNVPEQRDEKDPGFKGDVKWGLKSFWTSTKWMCITILAPEVLITLNLGQLFDAMNSTARLKKFAKQDRVPWTLTHSLFANMGGFVLREYESERDAAYHLSSLPLNSDGEEGVQKHEQAQPVGATTAARQEQVMSGSITYLLAHEILELRSRGLIKLPYITKEEIMDKSKSDSFARLLAISQTLWLVVQMIVRASRHLEVSQLEIGTTAFASCAVTIYVLNWHKPKGVGVPWTIGTYPGPSPWEFEAILEQNPGNNWAVARFVRILAYSLKAPRSSSIPNHHRYTGDKNVSDDIDTSFWESYSFLFSSAVFGAIHFAAMKSTFPSHIEKVLWLAASSVCSCIALLSVVIFMVLTTGIFFIEHHLSGRLAETMNGYLAVWLSMLNPVGVATLYVTARLFLIVELFRCLFFLPPSAFVATWASNIPHVS